MQLVKEEFEKRRLETKEYLDFILALTNDIENVSNKTNLSGIPNCRTAILKANFILMLYNMIESTARTALVVIYEKIYNDSLTFEQCRTEIKELLISEIRRHLVKDSKVFKNAHETATPFFMCVYKVISDKKDFFSGNVDGRQIKKAFKQFGLTLDREGKEYKFPKSKNIKEIRNQLAHGEVSFNELGRNIEPTDLVDYYNQVNNMLKRLLEEVEDFVEGKKYRIDQVE